MQGLLGLFGHISVYLPDERELFISPGMGADKATLQAKDLVRIDLNGKAFEGKGRPPVEWPIHTSLHRGRTDALAIAHLHTPYATLFAIAKREFRPVTLQGALFEKGVPVYSRPNLIKTVSQGEELVQVMGDKRALLLRAHGIVVVGRNIEEMLYTTLILEDDSKRSVEAAALGEFATLNAEECRAFEAEEAVSYRSRRAWNYFTALEGRWDRQGGTGKVPLV